MPASVDYALQKLSTLSGFISAALVDSRTGSILGMRKSGQHQDFKIEVAASGNSRVMVEKSKMLRELGLNDHIEDILIVLGQQYHVIHPIIDDGEVFLYCILERNKTNILHVRDQMRIISSQVNIQAISV